MVVWRMPTFYLEMIISEAGVGAVSYFAQLCQLHSRERERETTIMLAARRLLSARLPKVKYPPKHTNANATRQEAEASSHSGH